MARQRRALGQRLVRLRVMQVLQAEVHSIGEIAKRFGVSEQALHRWRNQFGGLKGEEMKCLNEFERASARLKRLVADLAFDNRMLKDLAEGNF